MLKQKDLTASSGAGALAGMMAQLTTGMDIYPIELDRLIDAPASWNFYRPLSTDKQAELVESIAEKGILAPLVVWEQPDGLYMILSGHNRCRALRQLYEATRDAAYAAAPCYIKRNDELDAESAQAIVIDANWVQRTLSPSERAQSIFRKYVQLGRKPREEKSKGMRTYDIVADHFGLKATQIYQYTRLAQLEPEWLDCLDTGRLSVKAGTHLAGMQPDARARIAALHPQWDNALILSLPKGAVADDIPEPRQASEGDDETASAASYTLQEFRMLVPVEHYDAISKLVADYLAKQG